MADRKPRQVDSAVSVEMHGGGRKGVSIFFYTPAVHTYFVVMNNKRQWPVRSEVLLDLNVYTKSVGEVPFKLDF